jgi:hypothetical protein
LYEAIYGGFTPNSGEICAVVLVAQDARAATISLELARAYLKRSPLLSKFLVKPTKDTVPLQWHPVHGLPVHEPVHLWILHRRRSDG